MTGDENSSDWAPQAIFMRLFVTHEPALRAYARSMLPDWGSVDDALQEASVTMWQKLEQLDSEDGFLPWSKVILRYKCLRLVERLRREKPLLTDEVLQLLAAEADKTTPDRLAKLRSALDACLAEFSEPHQQLLLAPYGGAGRVKELAEQTGKSANAFYKLLGRLREKLSGCIELRVGAEGLS
jgi:RNA polymerase sigma-70 factor (ECF subfamily)